MEFSQESTCYLCFFDSRDPFVPYWVYFLVLYSSETPQLFTVLPEKRTATVGGAMMGSTHIYDMSTVMSRKGPAPELQGVEVALAPEELELDPMALTQKYEEHVRSGRHKWRKKTSVTWWLSMLLNRRWVQLGPRGIA